MGAFQNPANTEVPPEVSCTNRPADSSYAHVARPKSWCAANVTGAIATAPTAAQISPDEAANAKRESAISKVASGATRMQRAPGYSADRDQSFWFIVTSDSGRS